MRTIGVDVGGTKILCRLVDPETGKAWGRVKTRTPKTGPDDVLAKIVELIHELDPDAEADGIGVGFPGYVQPDGVVVQCANIQGWDGPLAVGPMLAEILKKPVAVGNDVSLGALAEHRCGAGRGLDDLLAVFVGTGVGGALLLDGQVRNGPRGLAGEFGHMTIEANGPMCGCGIRGHLEAYAGKAGIEAQARRLAAAGRPSLLVDTMQDGSLKSRHVHQALEAKDEVAIELMQQAADALALTIGNVSLMLDVRTVVLGGGIVGKLGQTFLDQISASNSFGGLGSSNTDLVLAHRMDDAGSVGAALLVADQISSR